MSAAFELAPGRLRDGRRVFADLLDSVQGAVSCVDISRVVDGQPPDVNELTWIRSMLAKQGEKIEFRVSLIYPSW